MSNQREIPKSYEHRAAERAWRERWDAWNIYRFDPTRPREESFLVDSPPPTVSGSLHVGHGYSYTHQDLIVRFHRMRGRNVAYPMGWDDNGLPTERRVQNVFNVRCDPHVPYDPALAIPFPDEAEAKKKVEAPPKVVSRRNFIDLCQQVTRRDEEVFRRLFQRLSLSVDWSEEYATIDELCRASAQRSFVLLHRAGHVYQTDAPTMWDVDFQTAVAQAEVEDRDRPGAYHDIEFAVFEALSPSPLEGEGRGEGLPSPSPSTGEGRGEGETSDTPSTFIISTTRWASGMVPGTALSQPFGIISIMNRIAVTPCRCR